MSSLHNRVDDDDEMGDLTEYSQRHYKRLTMDDYLAYPPARRLLNERWNQVVCSALAKPIQDIFRYHRNKLPRGQTNILYRAGDVNGGELLSLVSHHLIPEYSTKVLHSTPGLLRGLYAVKEEKYGKIMEKKRDDHQKKLKNSIENTNAWGKNN